MRKYINDSFGEIKPQIIAVCGAGGEGKSCTTAYLSIALSKVTNKKVLCANINHADHASFILGIINSPNSSFEESYKKYEEMVGKGFKVEPYTELAGIKIPIYISNQDVHVLTYHNLAESIENEQCISGMCNIDTIFQYLSNKINYEYIVCDCGRGSDSSYEQQGISLADIIIIPISTSPHALRCAEVIFHQLKRMNTSFNLSELSEKKVYFFFNKGNRKLDKKFQKMFDDRLEDLIIAFKKELNINASVMNAVIPGTSRIEDCLVHKNALYKAKNVKDIADAYMLSASEIVLEAPERLIAEGRYLTKNNAEPIIDKEYDVFVSHASEDKEDFVKPLASMLRKQRLRVWYDEYELRVGDSLRESIDKGLIKSRFGIVVLSKKYIEKKWTIYELNSLISKEIDGRKIILPIWHNMSRKEIIEFSPMLADKVALSTETQTIDDIVNKLLDVINS